MDFLIPSIFFITDIKNAFDIVPGLLNTGIRGIQLRDKSCTRRDLYETSLYLRKITLQYGALFIVNDYPDLALASDADGVHLGQNDMPLAEARKIMSEKIIGISTHSIKQAQDAFEHGADYIGFGPIFGTSTKDAGEPKGVDELKRAVESVGLPVVAIGGINLDNVHSVAASGCSSIAVISALMGSNSDEKARILISGFGNRHWDTD
ncbi:MAG: thiamine phosphate synthase [Nitrospirae bacterium]|nr:thiamine phosphate synthase [Nitrospirota bacterium]